MDILLNVLGNTKINEEITISGSKSESNRLLILQNLFPELAIENLSDSDDSIHMQHALSTKEALVDIGNAFFNLLFCGKGWQRSGAHRF
jgi:3-phosphoshikimate 1-carboxyvinyltransferase